MPAVNPKMLAWAREAAGFSLQDAAEALGLTDTRDKTATEKLAALETGETEPTQTLLLKMSERYRRSLVVFYLNTPPPRGNQGQDFRVLPNTSTAEDARLDTLIRDIQTRQLLVKALLEDEEAESLPFVGSARMEEGIHSLAEQVQSTIQLDLAQFRSARTPEAAFSYLRNQIENIGIFVILAGDLGSYHTAIPVDIFRGFAIADPIAPFIVINNQDARSAQSFTALHEAIHIWLGTTGVSGTSTELQIEQFCNDVAGEMLLPLRDLRELATIQGLPITEAATAIAQFANQRRISRQMVTYKLYRAKMIGELQWRELNTHFTEEWISSRLKAKEESGSGGPSYYVTQGHRAGPALLRLVNRSIDSGALTPTKAGRVLGVKPRTVDPLLKTVLRQGGQ